MVGFGLGRVRVLFGFAFGLICSRSHKGHDLLEGLSPFTATRATICWRASPPSQPQGPRFVGEPLPLDSNKGHDLLESLAPFTATRATICWRGFGFGLVWLALGLVGFGLGLLPVGFGFVWVCFGFDWVGFGLG